MRIQYCITSDLDWASESAIEDWLRFLVSLDIFPTVFVTHQSPVVKNYASKYPIEIGWHPNFCSPSTHGKDVESVFHYVKSLYPGAKSFRTHRYHYSEQINKTAYQLGIRYESNRYLFLKSHLQSELLPTGLIRYPVFWEDDVHWMQTHGNWDLMTYLNYFVSPGLKVINIHPFFFYTNIPNATYYQKIKPKIQTVNPSNVDQIRYRGLGTRTFVISLLKKLKALNATFTTMEQLAQTNLFEPSKPSPAHTIDCKSR